MSNQPNDSAQRTFSRPPAPPATNDAAGPPAAAPANQPWPAAPPSPGAAPRDLTPPASWGPGHVGPGSPAGSVRPPDTSGTVDAPGPPRRRGGWLAMFMALLGAVIGTTLTLAFGGDLVPGLEPEAVSTVEAPQLDPIVIDNLRDQSTTTVVAAAVTPSVVRIDVGAVRAGQLEQLGLGSGVIISSDGYIVTNNHVVEGGDEVNVTLSDGTDYDAQIVGTDPDSDLAVVKIDATGLSPIARRTDDPVLVGEQAIAIGSPFGLDTTVTEGVVSAVGRDIQVPDAETGVPKVVPAVLQTDAAINPGNSGGALVDNEGRLLGINTAIFTESGGSQGVGFAIPADQAFTIAEQLIETGEVRRALLGVNGLNVSVELAERMGLPDVSGAMINEVTAGSGAQAAGLRPDDVIVAIDGEPIEDVTDLVVNIQSRLPGEVVTVEYYRNGESATVEVELGERPR